MRRISYTCAAAAALVLSVLPLASPDGAWAQTKGKSAKPAAPAYGNAEAITQEEMQVHLYFLASDQLEGRNFPSRGYDAAALYVASHLAEWGLKPGGSASDTTGPLQPYFMPIELVARQIVSEDSKLSLAAPPGAGRGGFGGVDGGAADAPAPAAGGGGSRRGGGNAEPRTTSFEYGKDWSAGPVGFGGFGGGGGRGAAIEPVDVSGNLVFAGNGYV